MKVGIGYDIHRLVEGRSLVLGGEELEHEKGLEGHSDADVLIHSVCDALLGAAGIGDLGRHFPSSDERYRDISSMKLLRQVQYKVVEEGFEINNIDVTVVCENPSISDKIKDMERNIMTELELTNFSINIKATTNEGLGSVGAGEAVASFAVASIKEL